MSADKHRKMKTSEDKRRRTDGGLKRKMQGSKERMLLLAVRRLAIKPLFEDQEWKILGGRALTLLNRQQSKGQEIVEAVAVQERIYLQQRNRCPQTGDKNEGQMRRAMVTLTTFSSLGQEQLDEQQCPMASQDPWTIERPMHPERSQEQRGFPEAQRQTHHRQGRVPKSLGQHQSHSQIAGLHHQTNLPMLKSQLRAFSNEATSPPFPMHLSGGNSSLLNGKA